jgi:histidyl-tRNA synthetase
LPVGERAERVAMTLVHRWRRAGARIEIEPGGKSLKSQMRRADKLGARYALIIGEDELAVDAATVRDLKERHDHPRAVRLEASLAEVRTSLNELETVATERRA